MGGGGRMGGDRGMGGRIGGGGGSLGPTVSCVFCPTRT